MVPSENEFDTPALEPMFFLLHPPPKISILCRHGLKIRHRLRGATPETYSAFRSQQGLRFKHQGISSGYLCVAEGCDCNELEAPETQKSLQNWILLS